MSDDAKHDQTPKPNDPREPFAALGGSELVAVTFVRDYVQLQFDGPQPGENQHMNVFTSARAYTTGRWLQWGEAGYRDALCERIGQTVRRAATEMDAERIVIEFADDAVFAISLRDEDVDEDVEGPEAAEYYHDAHGQHVAWVVWQAD